MAASSYPRFDGDTASVFLKYFAEAVSATGTRVHMLAPADPQVRERAGKCGVECFNFRYFPNCGQMLAYGSGILPNLKKHPWLALQIPFFLVALLISLIYRCLKLKPSIIHAHWIIPVGFISVIVGRILRIPVVITAHGGDAFALNGGIFKHLKSFTMKYSQAWTANTETTRNAAYGACADGACKAHVIPMGVDVGLFASGDSKRLRDDTAADQAPIILFVGRLVEKKGVRYLIEAVAELVKQREMVLNLWIVGDGERKHELEHIAESLGIQSFVEFKGLVPNDDLPDYFSVAKLFVAPSIVSRGGDTEGQGVVIIEAMAAGVPVIASRVGGIEDVIDDGETGVLVEPESVGSLADAIQMCLNDPNLSDMSDRAFFKVQKEYDWRKVARRFNLLYRAVAA
jgi:glycosyltransferase involved in cell wall biosynthesis